MAGPGISPTLGLPWVEMGGNILRTEDGFLCNVAVSRCWDTGQRTTYFRRNRKLHSRSFEVGARAAWSASWYAEYHNQVGHRLCVTTAERGYASSSAILLGNEVR